MERLTARDNAGNAVCKREYANNCNGKYSDCDYDYECFKKLADYEDLEEQGRLIILPKDGMVYHVEETENEKWVGNKPIQNIIFKCGWGFAGLEYSFWDLGKTFFFSREEAEATLRGD